MKTIKHAVFPTKNHRFTQFPGVRFTNFPYTMGVGPLGSRSAKAHWVRFVAPIHRQPVAPSHDERSIF